MDKNDNGELLGSSKDVIESYIFATSGRNFSIYGERLLLRLVEIAQQQLNGVCFRDGTAIGQVSYGPLGDALLEVPISSLLSGDGDTNYTKAKEALQDLMNISIESERPKERSGKPVLDASGKPQFEYKAYHILDNVELNVKPGYAVLKVDENTWKAILDFSKGFRKYDLIAALKFKRISSIRMFKLVSNQKNPMTYTIDQLREMWDMKDKYKDNSDFIRGVIKTAKEELDMKGSWSFDYVVNSAVTAPVNRGKSGKKFLTSVTFFPHNKTYNMSTAALMASTGNQLDIIDRMSYNMLTRELEFTNAGLKNNLLLFNVVKKVGMDLFDFLEKIKPGALRANSPQGYVIRALKRHLKERYGVDETSEGFVLKG